MDRRERTRLLLALAAAAGAVALALLLPVAAATLAALASGIAVWLATRTDPTPAEPVPPAVGGTAPAPAEPGLAAVAASIDEPLLFVERQQVTHANAAAIALLGAHIVGEDVRLAIRHPAAGERLASAVADPAGDDPVGPPPIELVGLGGSSRHWEMIVHALGRGGLLVRLADRTEARAAERMRVDFVANASHELRTPLATLLGYIETLEVANGPEEAATRLRFLATMMGEARRMQRLIDDLMSLSRIEAERHSVPQAAVALGALAGEVADTIVVARALGAGRIDLVVAEPLPDVPGDRAQLSQLLHNLIGNALKYGQAGGVVRVGVERAGAMVRLCVADEGAGIAREHLPRLTERFYRVDPGRSRAVGGTGLGLAIVKHIVERHRGRLEIESEVGVGTVVTVLLPAITPSLSSKRHPTVTEVAPNGPIERPGGFGTPVFPEAH